jgi:hypothetical protein
MSDYDQNGIVDAGDYLVWRKANGATGLTPYTGADGNGDGTADQADYSLWRFHFGSIVPISGTGSGASSADPGETLKALSLESALHTDSVSQPPALPGVASELSINAPTDFWRATAVNNHGRIRPRMKPPAVESVRDDALSDWVMVRAAAPAILPTVYDLLSSDFGNSDGEYSAALDLAVDDLVGVWL